MPVLVAIQTKLTVVEEIEREKRIPVICSEQQEALEYIKKGQATRPDPKWIAECLNLKDKPLETYDLYCGRKGFTDFIISKGQSLENASIFLGHKNIQTTWKFYKNRRRVDFDHNDFTVSEYSKKKTS